MRSFYDFEFEENGTTIIPISIGIKREDGATYYAEFDDYDWTKSTPWLRKNVLPYLKNGSARKSKEIIATDILTFVSPQGSKAKLYGYYSDYDHVCLCQLYGPMIDLPKNLPMFTYDIKQELDRINVRVPYGSETAHNSLSDAEWIFKVWCDYIKEAS